MGIAWEEREIQELRNYLTLKQSVKWADFRELSSRLNKTHDSIYRKAVILIVRENLGVKIQSQSRPWSEEEIQIISPLIGRQTSAVKEAYQRICKWCVDHDLQMRTYDCVQDKMRDMRLERFGLSANAKCGSLSVKDLMEWLQCQEPIIKCWQRLYPEFFGVDQTISKAKFKQFCRKYPGEISKIKGLENVAGLIELLLN